MSSIDKSLVENMSKEDLNELICGICIEIFSNPMVTPCCRLTYCGDCITRWLNRNNKCPNCRTVLTRSRMTSAPRVVQNILSNIRIKCKYHSNGCQTVTRVSAMVRHIEDCPHNVCDNCGIGQTSEPNHNCLQNLTIKVNSLSDENKRLTQENAKLKEQSNRLRRESRENYSDNCDLVSIASTSNGSISSSTDRGIISEKLEKFIKGMFILRKVKTAETFMEIKIKGNDFVFIRFQPSDGDQWSRVVKRFTLGYDFLWTRSDGKKVYSVFEFKPNLLVPSNCQFIEKVSDRGKITLYYYNFNILTNNLTIEWWVGSIRQVEVFKKMFFLQN